MNEQERTAPETGLTPEVVLESRRQFGSNRLTPLAREPAWKQFLDKFDEPINKTSSAEIDKYVTPLSRKTITLDIRPGPQSISIVGQMLSISRGSTTTRIDTPGTRIATASNFKFQEVSPGESLR